MKIGDRVTVHDHKKNRDYEFEKLRDTDTIAAFQNVRGSNHMASPAHVKSFVVDDLLYGGTPVFSEKAEKSLDTIEEVQKFNPFHDALGRFASSNSFRTYSANPKSKAGAMAIGRSARAGYTSTMNVHAESKGENVGQNYRWLETGKKPADLSGGSSAPTPPKPKATKPKQQKPKPQDVDVLDDTAAQAKKPKADQDIEEAVANTKLSGQQKLALQARDNSGHACATHQVAEDHVGERVQGMDISDKFNYYETEIGRGNKVGEGAEAFAAIDAVAAAQGWDKARPTVISDRDTFDKLCLENGCVLMRTVHAGPAGSSDEIATLTMTRNDTSLGAGEGTAYGGGLYMVNTAIDPKRSAKSMGQDVYAGQHESYWYGDTQMMATLRPGARIADYPTTTRLEREFSKLSWEDRGRFGGDVGAYIAAMGYDGAKWHSDDNPGAYSTIYNKSALVFFSEVAKSR